MGRILAIDYGEKRVGLAVTDPLQISTSILPFQVETKFRKWLLSYFNDEEIETIVIGYPEHRDGSVTALAEEIDKLVLFIIKKEPKITIVKLEESFTTKDAMSLMIKLGISKKKRREKGLIDSYSALVILNEYLDTRS